jgi:hypothetical protein
MTPAAFRRIALSLPEATESSHFGTPDFRVNKKIFATLGEHESGTGVVKLTPEQQEILVQAEPKVFEPVAGTWGRRGWTTVHIAAANEVTLRSAITSAWLIVAPKKLAADFRTRGG